MELREDLTRYIQSKLLTEAAEVSLQADTDVLRQGIIDSMGVFQVVSFLEETYGIRIEDDEITVDNFQSIDAMVQFVSRKLQQS
jgi:acyl carrier protein